MPKSSGFVGYPKTMASMPNRWREITPHDTNYLEGNAASYTSAVAVYTFDGGVIWYHDDPLAAAKKLELLPGGMLPGEFSRILATNTTATKIWAAFID